MILILIAADYLAICLAFVASYWIRFKTELGIFYVHEGSPQGFYSSLVFWLVPLIVVTFACYRLYSLRQVFDGLQEYTRIASASTLSMLLVVLVSFFLDGDIVVSRGWIVISWLCLVAGVAATRFSIRRVIYALRVRGHAGRRVALVAADRDADNLVGLLDEMPASGLHVALVIDPGQLELDPQAPGRPALAALVHTHHIDDVVVSAASVSHAALAGIVRELSRESADLHLIPGMYDIQTTGVEVREIHGLPLVTLKKVRITGFDFVMKRLLDYLVAVPTLFVLSPLLLTIAAAIKLTSPGPVLHRRQVMGERGRRFDALKFRTMRIDGDEVLAGHPELLNHLRDRGKLIDDPRITPIGRWLRRWSLDELPQLLNVVRGQMSLVGPRMITEAELDKFGHWRDNVITVKPGLTGLWQVSGRSQLGYDDRVRLDMYYIRSYSIWRDLEILMRTVPAVLRGVGAY
jgi:exopolysaccharide biosynthesis polyprenyl glycosylphosphotransferase